MLGGGGVGGFSLQMLLFLQLCNNQNIYLYVYIFPLPTTEPEESPGWNGSEGPVASEGTGGGFSNFSSGHTCPDDADVSHLEEGKSLVYVNNYLTFGERHLF